MRPPTRRLRRRPSTALRSTLNSSMDSRSVTAMEGASPLCLVSQGNINHPTVWPPTVGRLLYTGLHLRGRPLLRSFARGELRPSRSTWLSRLANKALPRNVKRRRSRSRNNLQVLICSMVINLLLSMCRSSNSFHSRSYRSNICHHINTGNTSSL